MRYGGPDGEKQRIRQETRQISKQLSPEYREEASRSITRQVLALPSWKKARTVMAYVSLPEEPDTRELIEAALREGKTLLLPRCVDGERMVAVPVKDPSLMKPGASLGHTDIETLQTYEDAKECSHKTKISRIRDF